MEHKQQPVFTIPTNTRKEVTDLLKQNQNVYRKFLKLTDDMQEDLIAFCMGTKGLKMTYDPFFKEILNPQYHKERLECFLSCILGQRVTIKAILPNESRRLASGASLLVMDMLVELEFGGLVNLEIQKNGYDFPGQRSACYSADLVMREYARIREELKKQFSYRNIGKVITIVMIEHSSGAFHQIKTNYTHHFKQTSDTGLELDLLQEYIFIALDVFREITHNVSTELEAWMFFLSSDKPSDILMVTEVYPYFRELYADILKFQHEPEELVNMFSEALEILDRNTVQYMIEERDKIIKEQMEEINLKAREVDQVTALKNQELALKNQELASKEQEIEKLKRLLAQVEK